jgi:TetR/AcrR family tetracycline transcriptional repressor
VLGDVLEIQAEDGRPAPAASDADPPGAGAGAGDAPAGADAFPLLRAATGSLSSPDERFEYGLEVLIDGLRARLAERVRTRQETVSGG